MLFLAAPVLALALATQPAQYDTVVLHNGGVLRGTVVEDLPGAELVFQLADGSVRRIPRAEVSAIYYAGWQPAVPPPPPPAEAAPEPPPELPGAPAGPGDVSPWQFAVALGVDFPLGTLDGSGPRLANAVTVQFDFTLEAAYRILAPLDLGIYLRIAGGSSQPGLNQYCAAEGVWCDSFDLGLGPFARWNFIPQGPLNPWVALGFGVEWLDVSNDDSHFALDYTGWELIGSVGLDWRLFPGGGVGLFASGRWGQFEALSVSGGLPVAWTGPANHGWFVFGVRCVYGP